MMNSNPKPSQSHSNDEPRLFWLLEHSYPVQPTHTSVSRVRSRWLKTGRGCAGNSFTA